LDLANLKGEKVTVVGFVGKTGTTGNNQRLFWYVREGLGYVMLSGDKHKDKTDLICIFEHGPPGLAVGELYRIRGTYRGNATSVGTPLLEDCDLLQLP
jgi:hypothetical protein